MRRLGGGGCKGRTQLPPFASARDEEHPERGDGLVVHTKQELLRIRSERGHKGNDSRSDFGD